MENNPFAISYAPKISDVENLDDRTPTTDSVDLNAPIIVEQPKAPSQFDEPVQEAQEQHIEEVQEHNDVPDDITVNAYYAAQRHLLAEGLIKEEDLKTDATWEDIEQFYETRVGEKVKAQVMQEYEAQGHNEQTLMYARLIAQGISPESLKPVNQLYQIASLKGRDDVELTPEQKSAVIESMYQFKQYDPNEYKVIIENAKKDEGDAFETLYAAALDYHEDGYKQIKAADEAEQKRIAAEATQKRKESEAKLKEILSTRQVGDVKFSPKSAENLRSAIYDRDVEYEYQGQKQRGSKMDAFLAEFYQSDEMKIAAYLLLRDKDGVEKTEVKKVKQEIEREILAAAGINRTQKTEDEDKFSLSPKKSY